MIPGAVVNAGHLRADKVAQAFTRAFFEQRKPGALICHGPWLLIDADVISGRNVPRTYQCRRPTNAVAIGAGYALYTCAAAVATEDEPAGAPDYREFRK